MVLPVFALTLLVAIIPVIAAQDTSTPPVATSTGAFEAEKTVLSDPDVTEYPELGFGGVLANTEDHNTVGRIQHTCKVQPEDKAWPSKALWNVLDTFVGDLEKPLPLAAPCYKGGNYNEAVCAYVSANWGDSDLQ